MPVITLDYLNTKIEDTYVRSSSPTGAFNTTQLFMSGIPNDIGRTFLKFHLGQIPNNAVINSAILKLYTTGAAAAMPLTIRSILSTWDENTTWNTKPIHDESFAIKTTIPIPDNGIFNTDITELVRKHVNGEPNFGITLGIEELADFRVLHSTSSATLSARPSLTIDYSIPTVDKKQVEVVGKTELSAATVSSEVPLTIPTGTQKGDLLVAYVTDNSTADIVTPVGWTKLPRGAVNTAINSTAFYKFAEVNEPNTTLGKVGGQTASWSVLVQGYRNVRAITQGSSFAARDSTVNYPNDLTINNDNNLIVLFLSVSSSGGVSTPPINFSKVSDLKGSTSFYETVSHSYAHKKRDYILNTDLRTTVGASAVTSGVRVLLLEPITNESPHIDGQDEHLGTINAPLLKAYSVTDTEGETITITEKVDGTTLRTYTGTGAQTLNLSTIWASLSVGKHTITIEANDTYDTTRKSVRTWTFLKILNHSDDLVTAIEGLGDLVPIVQGWKQKLVDKVGGSVADSFEANINKVIRKASGTVTNSNATKTFEFANSTTTIALNYLNVTDLPFRPKRISLFVFAGGQSNNAEYREDDDGAYKKTVKITYFVPSSQSSSTHWMLKGDVLGAEVTDNSFTLPFNYYGQPVKWTIYSE